MRLPVHNVGLNRQHRNIIITDRAKLSAAFYDKGRVAPARLCGRILGSGIEATLRYRRQMHTEFSYNNNLR